MSRLKTIAVWLMIALWLSSGFITHPHGAGLEPADSAGALASLTGDVIQDDGCAPAILPVQQVRTSGARLSSPLTDGPPFLFSRTRSVAVAVHPRLSDAPGLVPVTLAHAWRFLQRAAAHPRSPSPV